MNQGTALTRVVNKDRMMLAIQRADQRRMRDETNHFSFGPSKQPACCQHCGDVIQTGERMTLNETTGRSWCSACWSIKP